VSEDFLVQITGMVPSGVRKEQPERWREVLDGWKEHFKEYRIESSKQREEFDGIVRLRMAALIVSVAPPTEEEKGNIETNGELVKGAK
jgi:hypothetical protein